MINLENIALLICVLLLLETVFELIFIFVDAASKVAVGTVGVAFNVLAIIRDFAENPRPTKSLGDECAATGLFRYPSMERMQLYI